MGIFERREVLHSMVYGIDICPTFIASSIDLSLPVHAVAPIWWALFPRRVNLIPWLAAYSELLYYR